MNTPQKRRASTAKASRSETKQVADFGRKFREARAAANLTQSQTAELLGVARRAVQNWEDETALPIYPAQVGALGLLRGEVEIVRFEK